MSRNMWGRKMWGRKTWGLLTLGSSFVLCSGCSTPDIWLRSSAEMIIGFVLVPMTVIALLWFLYAAFLKKLVRARNIRVLRERREMREVVERSRPH